VTPPPAGGGDRPSTPEPMAPAAKAEPGGAGPKPPPHMLLRCTAVDRLAITSSPASAGGEEAAQQYLEPGEVFAVARAASAGTQRFFQLADGRGWVPERCVKVPSTFLVQHVPPDDASSDAAAAVAESAGGRSAVPQPHPQAHVRLRYLRVEIRGTRSPNTPNTQLAQIALRCRNRVLSLEGFAVDNPDGASPPSEFPEKVLATRGKFLDLNFRNYRRSVLMITAPFEIEVDDFALRTASDAPPRDPTSLRIDGSRDGWEWRTLHEAIDTPLLVPEKRLAWGPWLQLRPAADGEDLRPPAWAPEPLEAPAAIGWWRNVGKRLGVLKVPREGIEPQDHLQPGAIFPAIRVFTNAGRRYLQLPGGRGWVPECSRKDASRIVVAPCEPLTIPASLAPPASAPDGEEPEAKRARLAQERVRLNFASPAGAVRLRRLRIIISAARSPSAAGCRLGQLCLRCGGEPVSLDEFVVQGPAERSAPDEGPEKLLGDEGEWADTGFGTAGSSELMLVASQEVAVEDLALRTSGGDPGCDPAELRIEGSSDGEVWFVLHDAGAALALPLERRCWSPWLFLLRNPSAKATAPSAPAADAGKPPDEGAGV